MKKDLPPVLVVIVLAVALAAAGLYLYRAATEKLDTSSEGIPRGMPGSPDFPGFAQGAASAAGESKSGKGKPPAAAPPKPASGISVPARAPDTKPGDGG